jgi:hypothetical protein
MKLCMATSWGLYFPCRKKPQISSSPRYVSSFGYEIRKFQRNSAKTSNAVGKDKGGSLSYLSDHLLRKIRDEVKMNCRKRAIFLEGVLKIGDSLWGEMKMGDELYKVHIHVDIVSPLGIFAYGFLGSFPILFDGFVIAARQELFEVYLGRESVAQFRRANSKKSLQMGQCCWVNQSLECFDNLINVSVRCDVGGSKPTNDSRCF